ncbi:MAG TPA: TIM barrel protein [Streptosporangiaceae bacterium]|nr:TIM barrel protein [Streptosporangiaceae bacterium]
MSPDAGDFARHDLGIFARTFPQASAAEVAGAVAAAGFGLVQLNLSAVGLPTLPGPAELDRLDFGKIRRAFDDRAIRIWGLSASYNMIHPDPAIREAQTGAAAALIGRAPELGTAAVTLCTGTRDPDSMWRRHPGNDDPQAWKDLRVSFDRLLPAADAAGVRLGIEPEPGNVISTAARARRLLEELGRDAGLTGIIFDPANLVTVATAGRQADILAEAAGLLAGWIFCLHAKDVVESGYAAAGMGRLDYELIARLLAGLPAGVPLIAQDAAEDDVARVRDLLLAQAGPAGLRAPEPLR